MSSFRVNSFKQLLAGTMAGGAALALAACGASGAGGSGASGGSASAAAAVPTAAQIAAAIKGATSVRMSGSIVENGSAESLNLAMFTNGNMSGTVASGKQAPISLMVVNKVAFIQVTPAFIKAAAGSSASCNGQCGKYLKASGAEGASLTKDISMTALLGAFTKGLPGAKEIGTTTVNGQQAFEFRNPDGSILDVAASGPPYPLKAASGTDRSNPGSVLFSQWNAVPVLTAPPASDLADPLKLAG